MTIRDDQADRVADRADAWRVADPADRAADAADQADALPPMRMYFHGGTYDMILFRGWVPTVAWQYALSCLAVIAMGIVVQGARVRTLPKNVPYPT